MGLNSLPINSHENQLVRVIAAGFSPKQTVETNHKRLAFFTRFLAHPEVATAK